MKKLIFLLLFIFCVSCNKLEQSYYGSSIMCDNVCASMQISEPDYCGGCTIYLTITNNSNKTIKKINCEGIIKDYYGEPLQCSITNRYWASFYPVIGPIYNNESKTFYLLDKFYNAYASYVDIAYIEIYYEDGSHIRKGHS